MAIQIRQITPYTGNVPVPGQAPAAFSQNAQDQLTFMNNMADELINTISDMNNSANEMEINAASASQSAAAAEASASTAGYQGLWPDTGGSASKGETYQTQVGGTPTGNYFTALQNTTVVPVADNVNWKVDVSGGYVNKAQEELIDGSIFPVNSTVQNGDTVPMGTTHLRVLISGKSTVVAISPVASGIVSLLTEDGATIGATNVSFNKSSTRKFKYLYRSDGVLVVDGLLSLGDMVVVDNYHESVDSGILFFRVVDAGTGVHDGGKFIDLPLSGLQLRQNLKAPYNVKAWGAVGDGVKDDTTPIQSVLTLISLDNLVGGVAYIPSGKYRVNQLEMDLRNGNVDDIGRVTIKGDSYGSTMLLYDGPSNEACVRIFSFSEPVAVSKCEISDIFLKSNNEGSGTGMMLENSVYFSLNKVRIHNFDYGIFGDNALSLNVCYAEITNNVRGAFFQGEKYTPNAISMYGCSLSFNDNNAITVSNGIIFNMFGGTIENNGLNPVDSRNGGIVYDVFDTVPADPNGSLAGTVGLNIDGVYFEGNKGPGDIQSYNDNQEVVHTVKASTFNRFSSLDFTENNIACTTTGVNGITKLNVIGCGFKGFGTYGADISRRYIAASGNTYFNDGMGSNFYANSLEVPNVRTKSNTVRSLNFAFGNFDGDTASEIGNIQNCSCTKINDNGLYHISFDNFAENSDYQVGFTFDIINVSAAISNRAVNGFDVQVFVTSDGSFFKPTRFGVTVSGVTYTFQS